MIQDLNDRSSEFWKGLCTGGVSDLNGNTYMYLVDVPNGYFRIDPNIEYHFLSEDERTEQRLKELRRSKKKARKRKTIYKLVLDTAFQTFSPTQKDIFLLYMEGKTWTEIALERGCTESNIRQTFFGNSLGQGGIINKLKKHLAEYENYFDSL